MRSDDFDAKMRRFESVHDLAAVPGVYLVARLDGRGFTRLTKVTHPFETPFDVRFRDHMIAAVRHLMGPAGFRVVYAHTQSDEISLLFDRSDDLFDRKLRKIESILAGETSAAFSLALGGVAAFDCRVSQLPSDELVADYFRWRQSDANRNALNAHCYWLLRKNGNNAKEADALLRGKTSAEKTELLTRHGVNFARIPYWQKRGVGLYWTTVEKVGRNPKTGIATTTTRRLVAVNDGLPTGEAYGAFVLSFMKPVVVVGNGVR